MSRSQSGFTPPALIYRDLRQRYIRDPRLGHRLGRSFPNGVHVDETWGTPWLGTNANGFYGQEGAFDLSPKGGVIRILILGGSAAMGLGATQRESVLANRLMKRLRDLVGSHVEVLNGAVGDYASSQSLLYFITELVEYKPNIVICLDGFNDFSHSSWGTKFANGDWLPNTTRSFDDSLSAVLSWDGSLDRRTTKEIERRWNPRVIRREGRHRKREGRHSASTHGALAMVWDEPSTWSFKGEAIQWYLENRLSLKGVCKSRGIQLLHAVQPSLLWAEGDPATEEEAALLSLFDERLPMLSRLAPTYLTELAKESGNRLQAQTIDSSVESIHQGELLLSGAYWLAGRSTDMYSDPIHYNDAGQDAIAVTLTQLLSEGLGWVT